MQVGYTMRVTMRVLDPNASLFFLGQTDSLTDINDAPRSATPCVPPIPCQGAAPGPAARLTPRHQGATA